MAFITNKEVEIKTRVRNFYEFYADAESKGISITPFDIYKYVESFENIETINDVLESNYIGMIHKQKVEGTDGYVIAINKYLPIEYQRTILARLFGHLVLHREHFHESIKIKSLWNSDEMSNEANIFASKLLIPETELFNFIKGGSSVGKIADYFKVAVKMAHFRAFKLGLVDNFE